MWMYQSHNEGRRKKVSRHGSGVDLEKARSNGRRNGGRSGAGQEGWQEDSRYGQTAGSENSFYCRVRHKDSLRGNSKLRDLKNTAPGGSF